MSSLPALKRGIRFRDLALFYVVVSLGLRWTATTAAAGPSSLVVWFGALFCFFIPLAATVMELSERLPQEGGLYVWSREAFGDFAGFIAAWTYWMSNLPLFAGMLYFGAASVLFAFGARAQSLAASPLYYISFAVISLTVITLLNIRGIQAAKWLNNIGSLGSILPSPRSWCWLQSRGVDSAPPPTSPPPAWFPTCPSATPSSGPLSAWLSLALSPAPPWATKFRIPGAPFPGLSS